MKLYITFTHSYLLHIQYTIHPATAVPSTSRSGRFYLTGTTPRHHLRDSRTCLTIPPQKSLLQTTTRSQRVPAFHDPVLSEPSGSHHNVVTIVFSYPPELDAKTLLLKTPNTLFIGHEEMMLILTRKLPPNWLALIVLKCALLGEVGESSSLVQLPALWTTIMTLMGRYTHGLNSDTNVRKETNCCMV